MQPGHLVGLRRQQQRKPSSSLAEGLALATRKQHSEAQLASALCKEQISRSWVHVTAQLFLGTPPSDLTLHLTGWRPTLIRDRGGTLHCCFSVTPEGTQADGDRLQGETREGHNPDPTAAAW